MSSKKSRFSRSKKRSSIRNSFSNAEDQNNEGIEPSPNLPPERKRVSVKDFAVLLTLATVTASGLVTAVFGYDVLIEKCQTLDLGYIIATLVLFATVIGLFTYALLRMAAHYLVYVGIGVLLTCLNPCQPSRVKRILQRIFNKKKE